MEVRPELLTVPRLLNARTKVVPDLLLGQSTCITEVATRRAKSSGGVGGHVPTMKSVQSMKFGIRFRDAGNTPVPLFTISAPTPLAPHGNHSRIKHPITKSSPHMIDTRLI
jgi:hypothetical protein